MPGGEGLRLSNIHVAIGTSARSSKITKQQELTFDDLVALLQTWPVHVGQLTLAEYNACKAGADADKNRASLDKDTRWFSLASYSKPRRAAENVVEVSAFVGDFDSGQFTSESISAVVAGYRHIVLTSYSHSPEHPKFRLIIPYAQPVTPEAHATLFESFMALFGEQVDASTRDACRLWYFPSCVADMTEHQGIWVHEGELFQPYEMPVVVDGDPLPQKEAADVSVNDELSARAEEYETPDADTVRAMLGHIALEDAAGKRRGPWFTILSAIHNWAGGSDEGFEIADTWSATQPGYVSSEDVRKIWESCGRYSGKQTTIATVIKMAIEAGFKFESEMPEPDPLEALIPEEIRILDGGGRSFRETMREAQEQLQNNDAGARVALEKFLIYVTDQQEFFSTLHRTLLNKDAIRVLYQSSMPLHTKGGHQDPCKVLLESTTKRVVSSMGYHPGEGEIYWEGGRSLANWHTPYVVEPLKPLPRELEMFRALIAHLFPNREDAKFAKYLLQFFAFTVQKPGVKITSAPLLFSQETGTGKTTMMYEIPARLVGVHNCTMVTNAELESSFSDFLARKHMLHLDEIFMGGMKAAAAAANQFKPIVTNSRIKVHPKGLAGYDITNRLVITACSNYPNALYLSDYDRRWAVHEVTAGKMDKVFAEEFYSFMMGPRGPGVLKHIFLNIPTTDFKHNADAPMTHEKRAMIESSRTDEEATVKGALENYLGPFEQDVFLADTVLPWIESETGRKCSARRLQFILGGIDPRIKYFKRLRWGKSLLRVWCCRNWDKWDAATGEEICKALGIRPGVIQEELTSEPS